MKTALYIIFIIVVFLFLARTQITLKPFSITFQSIWYAIGWILVCIGIVCIGYHYHSKGVKQGHKDVFELVEKIEKEKQDHDTL